ncbi:Mediator of RNA polymerase II transcription subunit 6 [Linnemannia exigua]|uniref:Mediator of RNA polymerase II transcription subunit 6 n=1 Tax=Linnemannia exigua TaxID=604196 RepID=A0AAD4DIY9_9FUNG|nr:Mediator of RNA polymerase II transcription subunit 6 [Linnemannia exigua]
MADTNLLNVEWRFHEWIMGVGGLTPDNVLDYFAQSPFWDSSCNNAIIRMQTQFNNLGEMTQKLREQTGMEFALVHERYPALFIIQKQERKGPDYVIPMDIYYVLNGSIYMNPDLQTLLSNRVLGSLFYVESAFNEARTMTEFHPSTGYHWKAPAETVPAAGAAGAGPATPALPGLDAILAPGVIGSAPPKAESKEFCAAVDRAFKSVEQQMHIKQLMVQAGNATAAGAAGGIGAGAGSDGKIKQEGASGTGAAGGGATNAGAAKGTPKSTAKRRKKSEEASAAAASMGINTSVAAASQSRGPPSAGVTPGGPATPTSAPVKRRKKTKNVDPK